MNLQRFKFWKNAKLLSEEDQNGIRTVILAFVVSGGFLWVATIPNGAYLFSHKFFTNDLPLEISYIKQIWGIRKYANYD